MRSLKAYASQVRTDRQPAAIRCLPCRCVVPPTAAHKFHPISSTRTLGISQRFTETARRKKFLFGLGKN